VLEVTGIRAGYGRVPVLHDAALRVAPGEIVALLGANGAGKTTFLRCIAGGLRPWAGSVRFDGVELAGLPAERVVRAGLALVPEGRRLFAGLTVRENLLLGAYARRRADFSAELERVLDLFPALAPRAGQVAGRLSGGEQQMCAIGRALMSRPRLLMIDEMSLGLGPAVVDDLLALLPELAGGGTAVLLVEQDVEAALSVAARGYVLELGAVVQQGEAAHLLADPRLREAYLGTAGDGLTKKSTR
jgi:branched-chain amino acid transport system ATP-binding protein